MKRLLVLLAIALLIACTDKGLKSAHADETPHGKVNLTLDFPTGLMADAYVTLRNITTNDEKTYLVRAKDGGKLSFMAEFGTYSLVGSSVCTTEGIELEYSVVLNDFSVDESNPNGDWSWDVEGIVRNNKLLGKTTPTPAPTPAAQDSILTYTIEDNNAYFPGMTIPQIQAWYTNEATKFVESGKLDVTLEVLQADVTKWADWVTRKNNSILKSKYRVDVEAYNTDETKSFYNVQKKIYDFLWDFYKETGKGLNFNTWVYETEIEQPTATPTPVVDEVITPTAEPIEELKPIPTEVPAEEPSEEVMAPTDTPKKENKFIAILKDAWVTILILVVVLIGGIVWRTKYKKSDD